jgi:hypothetical protein
MGGGGVMRLSKNLIAGQQVEDFASFKSQKCIGCNHQESLKAK